MLIKNPGYYHWCTFYLYKPLQIHKVPFLSKVLPSFLSYPVAISSYCQGSWGRSSVNWRKQQWVLVGRLTQTIPAIVSCCQETNKHSLFGDPPLFTKAALITNPFYSSESKRENHRRAHQETACEQGWKVSPSVADSIWTKNWTHVLGLLWITSHLQCNSWTMFVEVFKYKDAKIFK